MPKIAYSHSPRFIDSTDSDVPPKVATGFWYVQTNGNDKDDLAYARRLVERINAEPKE
jgi:hypothetical protein